MVNALEVEALVKKYESFTAVNSLSFNLEKGKTLGLLGTNGAGKTTTIKMILGQFLPTSGSIRVFGLDPQKELKHIHSRIGYIPDKQSIYDELPVFENIDYFRQLYGLPQHRTSELIEKFGLQEKAKTKLSKLSRGLRQRVLIARSIVHTPELLILDEPTTGLDPHSANDIYTYLEDLKKEGVTILITTHLMTEVERLCDQIVFLHLGQKIAEGSPFSLKMRYKKNTLLMSKKTDAAAVLHEEHPLTNEIFESLKNLYQQDRLVHLQTHSPSLDEVFVRIVKGTYDAP